MNKELTVEAVIATYIKLRMKKEKIAASVEADLKSLSASMAKLEGWLMTKADEMGVKSFKTDAGTAFLTTTDYASVADWDEVLAFVKKNEAWHMLTHGVAKTAVREYIDSNNVVPNGVNFGTRVGLNVRKPTKKAED